MRILLINANCQYASTGKITYDLYERLRRDGHDTAICYGRGNRVKIENVYKFGLDIETLFHAGLARITGLNGYFSYFSTKRLINYIERFNPDIIHIHELHAYFVNIKYLIQYLKRKHFKIIWTFHCEYMYTGKCGYTYECNKWKIECGKCPAVKDYPKSLALDFTKKMFNDKKEILLDMDFIIIAPSRWLADRVKESFLSEKDIRVINNGIDTDNIFYPRNTDYLTQKYQLQGKEIVLAVAPDIMDHRKGGKYVIELSKRMSNSKKFFVLVGAKETKRMGNNILLVERTKNQDELAMWYSVADYFLICSKKENFPTTCLEALACGTPVIGFDTGGTKETVPYPYGRFVEYGCLSELEYMLKNKQKKVERKELSELAREMYSKEKMYNNYMCVYEEMLNG